MKCTSTAPGYRSAIIDGETVVGQVTASAWSPYLNVGVGYARFSAAGSWVGRKLVVEATNGETVGCEIVDLPFYDRDKLIPRGLRSGFV